MVELGDWPAAPALDGRQVRLEPLRVEPAQEMAPLLDDPNLHTFTGGAPASLLELQQRYRRQVAGRAPDGSQVWLNWVVRRLDDGRAIGTVQAPWPRRPVSSSPRWRGSSRPLNRAGGTPGGRADDGGLASTAGGRPSRRSRAPATRSVGSRRPGGGTNAQRESCRRRGPLGVVTANPVVR
jgi:hypothetical protein